VLVVWCDDILDTHLDFRLACLADSMIRLLCIVHYIMDLRNAATAVHYRFLSNRHLYTLGFQVFTSTSFMTPRLSLRLCRLSSSS